MPTDRLKPPPQEEEADAPAWMVTFADMMTLLLCFFALLLSFSQVDATKYPLFIGSIKLDKECLWNDQGLKTDDCPWPGNSCPGRPERSANASGRAPVPDTQFLSSYRIKQGKGRAPQRTRKSSV